MTDDILERLFTAVRIHGDVQLLADAHSAIYRLTAENDRIRRETRHDAEQVAELTWQLRDEKVAHASEVAQLRAQLAKERQAHTRATNRRAEQTSQHNPKHDHEYRRVLGRLPDEIRRRRLAANQPAPSLVDTELLLGVLGAIEKATRTYDAATAPAPALASVAQQHPERMTA